MTQEAGIIRTANGLQEGLETLLRLEQTEIFEENEYYSLVSKNLTYRCRINHPFRPLP